MGQVAPRFNGKPTQVAGLFQGGSDRCFIMLDMSVENPWTVVFHEYAHQLLNGNVQGSIDLDASFADSYALLAFAQSSLGDAAKALVSMQKAFALSPQNRQSLFNLANLYYVNRQPEQTISLLESGQTSDSIDLATRAAQLLSAAQQMSDTLKRGALVSAPAFAPRPEVGSENGSVAKPSAAEGGPPTAVITLSSQPAKYLRGTLTSADCSTPPVSLADHC